MRIDHILLILSFIMLVISRNRISLMLFLLVLFMYLIIRRLKNNVEKDSV